MKSAGTYESDSRIEARRASADWAPDGDLEKEIWKSAAWCEFDSDMNGLRHFPEAATQVAARWTPANLYVAFCCRYTALNTFEGEAAAWKRWGLWNRDVVEVFANPQPGRMNHYYEFEVAPNNQWIDLEIDKTQTPFNDAGWNSGFEHATRIQAARHVWTCEMRIPVAPMGINEIIAGAEWRINFFRADGAGDDSARRLMAWSAIPEGGTFHIPARFGTIRFVD